MNNFDQADKISRTLSPCPGRAFINKSPTVQKCPRSEADGLSAAKNGISKRNTRQFKLSITW